MIDRALAQHAGPAPDRVSEHLGARRPLRGSGAVSCSRVGPKSAATGVPDRARPVHRARVVRHADAARARSTPASVVERGGAGQVDDVRARAVGDQRCESSRSSSRVAGAADQHARALPVAHERRSTSAAKCAGQPPLRRAVRRARRQHDQRPLTVPAARRSSSVARRVDRVVAGRRAPARAARSRCRARAPDAGSTPPDARCRRGRAHRARQQRAVADRRRIPIARECRRACTSHAAANELGSRIADVGARRAAAARRRRAARCASQQLPCPLERRRPRRRRARVVNRSATDRPRGDDQPRAAESVAGRRRSPAAPSPRRRASWATARAPCTAPGSTVIDSVVDVTTPSCRRLRRPAPDRDRAIGDASTATAPDGGARTSRARRCSAA